MRLLFFLLGLLTAYSASAATSTSINVPITVTHQTTAAGTTYTFLNNSGQTLPAGFPVTLGQGFRRGDVLPGTQMRCVDPGTSTDLNCQWDQLSTRHQNGDDNSWRHGVWTIDLLSPLAVERPGPTGPGETAFRSESSNPG